MHIYICTQRDFEDKISLTTPDTYEKVPIVFSTGQAWKGSEM